MTSGAGTKRTGRPGLTMSVHRDEADSPQMALRFRIWTRPDVGNEGAICPSQSSQAIMPPAGRPDYSGFQVKVSPRLAVFHLCDQRWAASWYSLEKNFVQQSSVPDASECHCVFLASHSFPPCVDADEPGFTSSISTSRTRTA
jgi:hypothetical protein